MRAVKEWLERSDIKERFLFRAVDRHGRICPDGLHPDSVGGILKRMLGRAGYNPASYGGHSLRAGFATPAAVNGATELEIMRQTGPRSLVTLRRYIREGQLFRAAAAAKRVSEDVTWRKIFGIFSFTLRLRGRVQHFISSHE